MRAETRKICTAFINGETASAARTRTDGVNLWLLAHRIAWWDVEERSRGKRVLHMNCCGWGSRTTFDRLNGLLQLLDLPRGFFTQKGVFYFGSILRPIDVHETITINVSLARELSNDNTIAPSKENVA